MDYLNLAGRFGFADQIRNGTVIRGAVGQVYDNVGFFGTIFGSVLSHNTPVLTSQDLTSNNGSGQFATTLATVPVPPGPFFMPVNGRIPMQNGTSYQFRPTRMQLPKVDQYNLSLQQQITNDLTATLAYVGNIGEHVYPGETYGWDIKNQFCRRTRHNWRRATRRAVPSITASRRCTTARWCSAVTPT